MDEMPTRQRPRSEYTEARQALDTCMHDLRTPLTVAMLRLSMLRRRLQRDGNDPGLDADLYQIEEALSRLATVIAEMDETTRPR